MFLPDTLFRHLTCALEFYDLPVARYEAWRTRDPADACLRLVALTKLGMSDERAEQIEKALFSLRPADEISAVGWREIRAVLSAHRIFREAQRDEVDRERSGATSMPS